MSLTARSGTEPGRPQHGWRRTLPPVSSAAWCSPELVFPRSKPAPPVWPARETSRLLRFLIVVAVALGLIQQLHGDLFASVFVAAKMKGLEIGRCAQIAADFVSDTIARTVRDGTDERYGVNFEQGIPDLISRFQKEALL